MATIETYVPLYRKYRPQLFDDLVGQAAISQTLVNAIHHQKVAHAYLFCGPRGTGKTSTARIFAKSLNCENGPTEVPCQTCASCIGITVGNALDVIEIDAASNNGVEDARELIENCQFAPMAGRFKIYIIDEVHMLSSAAFNALLKTLEEPPANVVFMFATTEAHKVLPTIISRCQRFDFSRITLEDIMDRLRNIAKQEIIEINDEALFMIARHARGGLRDAVGLLDQVSVIGRAQPGTVIGSKEVVLFIGALEEDVLLNLANHIGSRDAAALLADIEQLVNRGIEPAQIIKDLTYHFRNLLVVKACGPQANPNGLGLTVDYFKQLLTQAELYATEEIPQILAHLGTIERNLRNTQQPQLWLEIGLIDLAYRHDIHVVEALAQRVSQLEALLQSGGSKPVAVTPNVGAAKATTVAAPQTPKPIPPVAPAPTESTQPEPAPILETSTSSVVEPTYSAPTSGNTDISWPTICDKVSSLTTKSLLKQHTFLLDATSTHIKLGCASEPTLNLLKKPDKWQHLQKAVNDFFGTEMKIELLLEKREKAVTSSITPSATIPSAPTRGETPPSSFEPSPESTNALSIHDDSSMAASLETVATLTRPEVSSLEPDMDLIEAKKYTMELLQGKLVD